MDSVCNGRNGLNDEVHSPNQNAKIKFLEEPSEVFAYLDEKSAEDGEWQLGCTISFNEYQRMMQHAHSEMRQDRLETRQQTIQEMCTELRGNSINYPIRYLINSHNRDAMAKFALQSDSIEKSKAIQDA
ncbi:hypothetical protein DdX_17670 [Ditylenchus destructor]|uniref:Uncharacterized protein n=1 Tax=Ditylenchus destructor TaxID=166010 RepID=A0AAD4MLB5_9BILA|nr:hypothetical protein DdX_17670 [Ditylenchus destructor]